jgi:CheY-like chemotaxis protein
MPNGNASGFVTCFLHACHETGTDFGHFQGMKPRVLVVDDDIEYAQLLRFNLELDGCETLAVHNGTHALRIARAELPDVILVDIMLPDLDGLSVCEILNSQPSTRDIPVIIVSALNQSWVETRRSKARFARFFTKPVDLKMLRETVRRAVKAAAEAHATQR